MTTLAGWLESVADLPRLERELLLGATLNLSRAQIIAFPETRIPDERAVALADGATALRNGTPIAYLLGEWEFWGLPFTVSPAVLIPRPETELLVELALEAAPIDAAVLELGTGSGAIAVALASERPDFTVTALDASPGALEVARHNGLRHQADVRWLESHWYDNLPAGERYDVIVANPPYIAANDPHLPALAAEPASALVAGEDGLDDIRHIAANAASRLHPRGCLIVEHGYDQAQRVRKIFAGAGLEHVRSHRDLAGIERATMGHR